MVICEVEWAKESLGGFVTVQNISIFVKKGNG